MELKLCQFLSKINNVQYMQYMMVRGLRLKMEKMTGVKLGAGVCQKLSL